MELVDKFMGLINDDHPLTPVPFPPLDPKELIDDMIWDTCLPVKSGTFTFFFCSRGDRRFPDTNMNFHGNAAYLPFGQRFMVTGISAEIVPLYARVISKEAHEDLQRISGGGIEIVLNNKIYNRFPISAILRSSVLASDPDPKMPSACSYCSAPIKDPGTSRCDYCGAVYLHPISESKKEKNLNPPPFLLKNGYIIVPGMPFSGEAFWPDVPSGENDLGLRLYLHGTRERIVQ